MKITDLIKQNFFVGVSWVLIGKIISLLAVIIINILITRLLSPEDVGIYFIIISLVYICIIFSNFGLHNAIVRLVAESIGFGSPGRAKTAIKKAFIYCIIGAILVTSLLNIGLGNLILEHVYHSININGVIILISLWIIIATLQNLFAESFRGYQDIGLASAFSGSYSTYGGPITSFIFVVLLVIMILFKMNGTLNNIILVSIISSIFTLLISAYLLNRKIKNVESSNEISTPNILSIAWPMFITNIIGLGISQLDIWVIGYNLGNEEVALYGASIRLAAFTSISLGIANSVTPPLIAEMLAKGEKNNLEKLLRSITTLISIPSVIVFLSYIIFGSQILRIFYGDFYAKGATILAILSFGQLVNVMVGSCGYLLLMAGHQKKLMWATGLSSLITILGVFLFVNDYGTIGIALAVAIGISMQSILTWLIAKKFIGIWTHFRIKNLLEVFKIGY
jgi:O-antigen/teichoic acid export membrane protein